MTSLNIDVAYSAQDGLQILCDQVVLETSEQGPVPCVTWNFTGIDDLAAQGFTPRLRFHNSLMGPFESFCQSATQLIGNGNTSVLGDFLYQATLQGPAGTTPIASETATLSNTIARGAPETAPFVEVFVCPDGDDHVLDVRPLAIARAAGQPVVWNVIGEIPKEMGTWYPRVVFDDLPEGASGHFGPFTTWQGNRLCVMGDGSSGAHGSYSYHFELVSLDREGMTIRSSPDPTLDDEGEPPGATVARSAHEPETMTQT